MEVNIRQQYAMDPEDESTEPPFIRTMIFHEQLEVVKDWICTGVTRREVSSLVLFTASLYGKLPILRYALPHGTIIIIMTCQRAHPGCNYAPDLC